MSANVPTSEEFQALCDRVADLEARLAADQPIASSWLTVKAAAEYTGLSEHALRKRIKRDHIETHQHCPGGRILLRRKDLDAALSERSTR